MYLLECDDEWNHIHSEDLWVYNKLFLSRVLGYTCGPAGTTVPKPDFYIVRPMVNLLGMGRFARKEWINCEFIGNKLIEVHFRRNPDFRYENSVAIPVWNDEKVENMTFIEDSDYLRKGFYVE